ncbi:MAG: alkaline phosphatase family protein [Candidatus Anammoxibacter sp.]
MSNTRRKVAVIGLDSIPPELFFDRWLDKLPNIKKLVSTGIYGKLESTIPAITCPAWTSMVTSANPGRLGIYGFRNRTGYNYDGLEFANSRIIREEPVWTILSKQNRKVIVIGVPQTYPPTPVNGCMITCFLTPDASCDYTYPPELKKEVEHIADGYMFDVANFRTDNKDPIIKDVYEMTRKRFKVARNFVQNKDWDFFMMVEMGPDRLHHAFWKFFDATHPAYLQGNKYENVVLDYYINLDNEIGALISLLGNDTVIMIVSDHGSKRMEGGICINEWLINNGYLKLVHYPAEVTPINKLIVDWEKTIAWGEGGYYGRLFMNVKDREPKGVVARQNYENVRNEIISKLEDIRDPNGNCIKTKAFKPEDIYTTCNGVPPDLIVYYGDLSWRSIGSVGHKSIWARENDLGSDDSNHAQYGIFLMNDGIEKGEKRDGLHLMDVAPTILDRMGIDVPLSMEGKVIKP